MWAWFAVTAQEFTDDQRFPTGLRERVLTNLAEACCVNEPGCSELADECRAELTIELVCILTKKTLTTPLPARAELWEQVRQTTEHLAQRNPQSPRLALVRFQAAMVLSAHGERARQERDPRPTTRRFLLAAARWHKQAGSTVAGLLKLKIEWRLNEVTEVEKRRPAEKQRPFPTRDRRENGPGNLVQC